MNKHGKINYCSSRQFKLGIFLMESQYDLSFLSMGVKTRDKNYNSLQSLEYAYSLITNYYFLFKDKIYAVSYSPLTFLWRLFGHLGNVKCSTLSNLHAR